MAFSRKNDGKPKVYFTYHQPTEPPKTTMNYSMKEHVYTEPANIKGYYREQGLGYGMQNVDLKKMGSYELQGNPRKYKNYAQQKMKYI